MGGIRSIVGEKRKGVEEMDNVEISWVEEELESVFNDELGDGIKRGMIGSDERMELMEDYLKED
ncbi:bifunctional hydroxymethylpyrimidine kinase/phosphomethylpyrimidine kinase [Staphylococcus haemolyticus]|uniref:bifunctional hydroxymethylpyrimidine kinase/phosphomethylpyrimidine kinase n=1 Tax=Staphylococcus haemolyticus TaxID=1283 RepID=UPI0011A225BC|nr:bifunctional hydroxymethylpyrimidine kinase/phosphomethylpyrimidine kinase [Staphylococcus haemolyticus]